MSLLTGVLFFLGVLILLGIYLVIQNKWIQVKHFHIRIPNSGKGIKGKKIVQLSDLHMPKPSRVGRYLNNSGNKSLNR